MEVYDVNTTVRVRVPVSGVVPPYELTLSTGNRKIITFKSQDLSEDSSGSYVTVSFDGRRLGPGALGYVILDHLKMWHSSMLGVELRRTGTYGRYGQGGGGVRDYAELSNKPKVNSVELLGNTTGDKLGLVDKSSALSNAAIDAIADNELTIADNELNQTNE